MNQIDKHILLARQPIYKRNNTIYGFELLFRNEENQTAMEVGEDAATSEVLVNYCTSFSSDIKHQHFPIFINVSETFLLSELFLPIDKKYVIIELLERIKVTDDIVKAIKLWKRKGFRFALDDFDFSDQWKPLLPYIDFIKVDMMIHTDMEDLKEKKESLSGYGTTWLAEKIEDEEVFNACKEMGFDLFQGYYLSKPKPILGNAIRPSSAVTAEIIKTAGQHNSSISDLAALVTRDPKLSMQLLKLINSSLFTLPRPIKDLKEAITFLGVDILKQWALMIAFVTDASAPIESSRIVLVRAKLCELLATHIDEIKVEPDTAFLIGLLSGVDLLLELQPEFFVKQMSFHDDIQQGVMGKGAVGKVVNEIKALEYCLTQEPEKMTNFQQVYVQNYLEAQDWSDQVLDALH